MNETLLAKAREVVFTALFFAFGVLAVWFYWIMEGPKRKKKEVKK